MLPFFERLEPCLNGMEACGTSHYRVRELSGLGHEVRLMQPAYAAHYNAYYGTLLKKFQPNCFTPIPTRNYIRI